jgi:hypothetical protein
VHGATDALVVDIGERRHAHAVAECAMQMARRNPCKRGKFTDQYIATDMRIDIVGDAAQSPAR